MSFLPECYGVRQVSSVIWALLFDGKTACAFRYVKSETVLASLVAWRRLSDNENNVVPKKRKHVRQSLSRLDGLQGLAISVTAKLQTAFEERAFDYLVIVAPRDSFCTFVRSLDDELKDRVLTNMPEGYLYDKSGPLFILQKEAFPPLGFAKEALLAKDGGGARAAFFAH